MSEEVSLLKILWLDPNMGISFGPGISENDRIFSLASEVEAEVWCTGHWEAATEDKLLIECKDFISEARKIDKTVETKRVANQSAEKISAKEWTEFPKADN